MTIVLTGGGTGGHITPLLAVARELKQADPSVRLVYIEERRGKFADLSDVGLFDARYFVFAGKFRRYRGESLLQKLLDIKTLLLNFRDAFYVIIGAVQALALLKRIHPQAILIKGSFVGVPVGLAAAAWHIPMATHDSDTLPGLTNRIVGRWASKHLLGMPEQYYDYPKEKSQWVGIPLERDFVPVSATLQKQYKKQLGFDPSKSLVFITGGSLGAQRLNALVRGAALQLFEANPGVHLVHQVGKGNLGLYDDMTDRWKGSVTEREFIENLYLYSGAADVIITRAGATTIAQFAQQGKACVVVPNPQLTGGHQSKNAQHLASKNAVIVVSENAHADTLAQEVKNLLGSDEKREKLGAQLQKLAKPQAAQDIARTLLLLAQTKPGDGK